MTPLRALPCMPRTTDGRLAAVVFLCLGLLYIAFCGSGQIYDMRGDASGYLLAAQYFSPFHAATPALTAYSREIIYPPLFPWLIAALGATPLAGNVVVLASLLGSFVLLFSWLQREGATCRQALTITVMFALAPITYLTALNLWTENPYLLFSLLSIYAVARAEGNAGDAEHGGRYWWIAAAAVAAASLTRVAALPLLTAFGLYLLLRRPRRYVLLGVLAVAPFCLWVVLAKLRQAGLGAGLSGYTSQWSALYADGAAGVLRRTSLQWVYASMEAWRNGLLGDGAGAVLATLAGVLGLLALVGWLERLRRLRFDALYVLCYLAMLFAWPHAEEASRYGYVLVPLLLAYPVLLVRRIAARRAEWQRGGAIAAALMLGVGLLIQIPGLAVNASRYFREVPPEFSANRKLDSWYTDNRYSVEVLTPTYVNLIQGLPALAEKIPAEDCVFAIKSNVFMLHTGRVSVLPPKSDVSNAEFAAGIQKCRYAFIIDLYSTSFREAYYPLSRLGKGASVITPIKLGEGESARLIGALVRINTQ